LMARRGVDDLNRAQAEFQRATELDPGFALAWVGIAETANLLTGNNRLKFTESNEVIENAARKALEINEQLGEAYLSLAEVDYRNEREAEAEANYRKAIELSPGYATAYQWYSDFLDDFPHRRKEALQMLREAEALDPLSSIIQTEIADQLNLLGQFEAAEHQVNRILRMDPDFAPAYREMADLMRANGRFDEQFMWLSKASELDPDNVDLYIGQAFALLDMADDTSLNRIRQQVAEIDDQNWALGWIETIESLHKKNYAAAMESAKWVGKQIGDVPGFQNVFGWVYLLNNDYQNARRSFSIASPEYFDRASWRTAIEQNPGGGCSMAYVLSRTGDEAMGIDLTRMTLSYLENELPNYIEHADRFGYETCYLMTGELEKAMGQLELSFAHGHHDGWGIWTQLDLFDPLRDTERFQAMMQDIRESAARQRANLEKMKAEAKT